MGNLIRVDFTCEGPEYFQYLAEKIPDKALELYRQFIDPSVKLEDITTKDPETGERKYMPINKWNHNTTDGAMHLIQGANSLQAEIQLAADGTVRRSAESEATQQSLIVCSQYGVATRNSDPAIGWNVNQLAQKGYYISLANPVGLFFHEFAPSDAWQTPDGTSPMEFWKWTRGTPQIGDKPARWVRATFEVPAEKGYTISEITIAGEPIQYAGQIADFVSIHLTAAYDSPGAFKDLKIYDCVKLWRPTQNLQAEHKIDDAAAASAVHVAHFALAASAAPAEHALHHIVGRR
jgi:hypothetical protein